jgi:D-xylose transport system permease protein
MTEPGVLVQAEESAQERSPIGARLWAAFKERYQTGEWGAVPVLVGLVLIGAVFGSLNGRFLSPENLTNLSLQIPATGMVALGIISVLLIGEVDLSAGSVSGLCAVVMTTLAVNHGVPPFLAVLAAVGTGALIGAFHGVLFTRVGIPSFVVTLAGLIGWQGVMLRVLGHAGTINLPFDGSIALLSDSWLQGPVVWILAVAGLACYAGVLGLSRARRKSAGLPVGPVTGSALRVGFLAALLLTVGLVLGQDRGIPATLLLFAGAVVVMDFIFVHTVFGRRVYAVGGNAEAARRAGINVTAIRILAFALSSGFAALGGVLAASRLAAVNQSSGGSDLLLNAIASAVIGGVSLFGGRGRTYAALLGVVVIQSITNGMLLLSVDSSMRFMVTAVVLVAAVATDSVARRKQPGRG